MLNLSVRYIFMEFKNADDAARALVAMNGHPFDAKHTFLINRFTDFERYLNLDETYVEPPPEEYKPKVSYLGASNWTGHNLVVRNTCVHGLVTLKAATNMLPTAATRWRSTGMASPRNAKSRTAN